MLYNFQIFLIGSVKYLIDVGFKCCSYLQEPAVMFSEEYQVSCLDFFTLLSPSLLSASKSSCIFENVTSRSSSFF